MSTANAILASIGLPEQKEVESFTLRFCNDQSLYLAISYADEEMSTKEIAYYYPSIVCEEKYVNFIDLGIGFLVCGDEETCE